MWYIYHMIYKNSMSGDDEMKKTTVGEKPKKSRYNTARKWLIFWTLFIGIGAVGGAVTMLFDPTGKTAGMDAMLPYFQKLPFADVLFRDFTFSGIALLIVNGLTNLTAATLLIMKKRAGATLGMTFGITLMLWICIQFYMFPLNFMSTIYFIFGFTQAATGYAALMFYKQEQFRFDEKDYPHVGTDKTKLVVYFSRMGYMKKKAYEAAEKSGACVYEIKSTELTEGTAGFWWCGRYGMHRWDMPIEPVNIDLLSFESVTICSPIWVFHLAAPVRAFCREAKGKIRKADYILVHHQKESYFEAADEMESLLGLSGGKVVSYCCREGKYGKKSWERV